MSPTRCDRNTGVIEAKIIDFYSYVNFNGSQVSYLGKQIFVNKREFTVEGIFRITEKQNNFQKKSNIGLFGQDNCIEWPKYFSDMKKEQIKQAKNEIISNVFGKGHKSQVVPRFQNIKAY